MRLYLRIEQVKIDYDPSYGNSAWRVDIDIGDGIRTFFIDNLHAEDLIETIDKIVINWEGNL